MRDFIRRLGGVLDDLTVTERRAAQYIEHNLDRVLYQTVREVADRSGVSQASVIRAVRSLGYNSFVELQSVIRQEHHHLGSLSAQLQRSLSALDSGDPVSRTLALDQEILARTYASLDREQYDAIVDRLVNARRIATLGFRASSMAAVYLALMLNFARPGVTQIRLEYDDLYDQLLDLGESDVIVALSFARPAKQTIHAVEFAKGRGVPIIGITGSRTSALGKLADLLLVVHTDGTYFLSYTAVTSVCNAVMAGVGSRLQDSAKARIDALDAINVQSNVL